MEKEEKKEWQRFYEEGQGFHRAIRGRLKRLSTPALVQNIAALGIEKYFMALCLRRGRLPLNHTMGDLLAEVKTFMALPADLEASLHYFDALQSICSLEVIPVQKPTQEDLLRFMDAIDRIALLTEQELTGAAAQGS
ncbi:MAG: hypothetical protein LBQ30_08465 [Treponema sp.]|nr:hypothetical protein [Treponema sp.]